MRNGLRRKYISAYLLVFAGGGNFTGLLETSVIRGLLPLLLLLVKPVGRALTSLRLLCKTSWNRA